MNVSQPKGDVFESTIVGRYMRPSGTEIVKEMLPVIRDRYGPDLVIANGENAAGGFGLTEQVAEELFSLGIDVLTSGNHIWDKRSIRTLTAARVC